MELDLFCQLFYASHYIPMALLHKGEIQKSYASIERPLPLYGKILEQARGFSGVCKVVSTEDLGLYGLVEAGDRVLLLGPVFSQPVTEKMVSIFARQNGIGNRDWSVLYWLLAGVPRYTYNQFYNLLRFLDLTLNGRNPEETDAIAQEASAVSQPDSVQARQAMRSPWEERRHETFQVENMILATVRDGDVDALKKLLDTLGKVGNLREGKVADTPLRQAKNIFLGLVSLVGKTAAIPGGMDDEEAYTLIDLYAQECEQAPTVEAVRLLQYNILPNGWHGKSCRPICPRRSPSACGFCGATCPAMWVSMRRPVWWAKAGHGSPGGSRRRWARAWGSTRPTCGCRRPNACCGTQTSVSAKSRGCLDFPAKRTSTHFSRKQWA